jgi:SagB-type dehydrogenase family enzyme
VQFPALLSPVSHSDFRTQATGKPKDPYYKRGGYMSKSAERVTLSENKIYLPRPQCDGAASLEKTLLRRRSVREFSTMRLELWQISQLAWAAQGITSADLHRTAPSAGALFPLEIYVAVGNVIGLVPGIYKYGIRDHDLVQWLPGDKRRQICEAALNQDSILKAPAVFIVSAIYERTTAKYGERGIRYAHMEAGHAAQNLLLQVVALSLGAVLVGAFDDLEVKRILNLKKQEAPLYLIPVGKP